MVKSKLIKLAEEIRERENIIKDDLYLSYDEKLLLLKELTLIYVRCQQLVLEEVNEKYRL